MNLRQRLMQIEARLAGSGTGEPMTASDMVDAELAEIVGGPGCRPEDLDDGRLAQVASMPNGSETP